MAEHIVAIPMAANVTMLRGVGPMYAKAFEAAEIRTIRDLLWSLPYRYIDRGNIKKISDLDKLDNNSRVIVTIFGTVKDIRKITTKTKYVSLTEVLIEDDTGTMRLIWFNQPYISNVVKIEDRLLAFAPLTKGSFGYELRGPDFEIISHSSNDVWTNRYLPLYLKLGPVTSRIRQKLVQEALHRFVDPSEWLPMELARNLPNTITSLKLLHQPLDDSNLDDLVAHRTSAHNRLINEELFAFALGLALRRNRCFARKGYIVPTSLQLREQLKSYLPFHLTKGQRQVFRDIVEDLTSGRVMHRLLHGDVGSGKTMIAFLAMAMIAETGGQAALMVTTEVLARQHAATFQRLLKVNSDSIQLLLGHMKALERRQALANIASGEASYVIGTHALFQGSVIFNNLQLVVVDEQHRFGVKQREAIKQKGFDPHWLVMSATPIPRSLALSLFGDLDQSILDELPPGRSFITTKLVKPTAVERIWVVVDQELSIGHQAFIVSPTIDAQGNSKSYLRNIQDMEILIRERFPTYNIAVVHGKLKINEITERMESFIAGRTNILLATTVIEVGVDVPNATVMVVDHAEHFGLSQLHQLRGRVGRGKCNSYFFMLSSSENDRLSIMTESQNGFYIAQKDLELRGPGEFFGTRQSGLPQFQVADLMRDRQLLIKCRKIADQIAKCGLSERHLNWLKQEQVRLKLIEVF